MTRLPVVTIYTDGACEPNPGNGGWGAILFWENGRKLEISGSARDTTNNRMELTAIIQALKSLGDSHTVELYSDSQYCGLVIFKRHAKKNDDLIGELFRLNQMHKINFHWVRGGTDPLNIMVDYMSKTAIAGPAGQDDA